MDVISHPHVSVPHAEKLADLLVLLLLLDLLARRTGKQRSTGAGDPVVALHHR
jgi:hypothetical protein